MARIVSRSLTRSLAHSLSGVFADSGTDLRGIHASTSWIALKGKGWRVEDNVGVGLGVEGGAGIRVLERVPTFGSDNVVRNNRCEQLSRGSVCVFVDGRTTNNTVEGNSVVDSDASARVTNEK